MSVGGIDSGRIQAMIAQLRAASAGAPSLASPIQSLDKMKGLQMADPRIHLPKLTLLPLLSLPLTKSI